MSESATTALETLVLRTPEEDAKAFLIGSLGVRELLQAYDDSKVLLPLRGAMPMFWAADGALEIEDRAVDPGDVVELPLGLYNYEDENGRPGVRCPSKRAKVQIINQYLEERSVGEGDSLTLLDEIQGGGTVVQFVRGALHYARSHGVKLPLHLIAAEDSNALRAKKTSRYMTMTSNQYEGVRTEIVRMPLVGLDKGPLLDKVTFTGERHLEDDTEHKFHVERNVEAERLFRALGSMMRNSEIVYDRRFMENTFDPLIPEGSEVALRFDEWLSGVLTVDLDGIASRA